MAEPQIYHNDEAAADALQGYVSTMLGETPEEKAPVSEPAPAGEPEQETPAPQQEPEPEEAAAEPEEDAIANARRRFRVKGEDGRDEEVEMTVAEMEKSVMMERDYRRKTADIPRRIEEARALAEKEVNTARETFMTHAQTMQRALLAVAAPELQHAGVDITNQMQVQSHLSKLAKDDPAEAVRLSNRLGEIFAAVQVVSKGIENESAKAKQTRAQNFAKTAREAWDTLTQDIKGWGDETYTALLKTGYEYGFKPHEIANPVGQDGAVPEGYLPATDPRFIKLLHDAHQFRQQQRQNSVTEKKVAEAPKVMRPGSKAKAESTTRGDEAMNRLRKSGKIDDAAAAIFHRLS